MTPIEDEMKMPIEDRTRTAWTALTYGLSLYGNPYDATHVVALSNVEMLSLEEGIFSLRRGETLELGAWSCVQADGTFIPTLEAFSARIPEGIWIYLEDLTDFQYCVLVSTFHIQGHPSVPRPLCSRRLPGN